jgi:Raf kinase inhibitor-like YbhB/YbcL family protein
MVSVHGRLRKRAAWRGGMSLSLTLGAALLFVLVTDVQSQQTKRRTGQKPMEIHSTAFKANQEIPQTYTCEGKDISPPLSWSGVPPQTKSLVVIVDDPDAPDPKAPKMTWVHWVVFNLAAGSSGLTEGVTALPDGAREGVNDFNRKRYGGPCPPIGRHRYFHKLYALDTVLSLEKPTKSDVEKAMEGHVLAKSELIGTYQKKAGKK